jgi:amino acid transporter
MAYTAQFPIFSALVSLSIVSAIGTVGLFFGYNTGNLATPGADPLSQFAIGSLIFAALVGINIWKPKAGFRLISVLTILAMVGLFIAIGVLFLVGRAGVVSYMNSFGNSALTFQSIQNGYSGPRFDLFATLSIFPFFSIFVYPYINGPAVAGSELKGNDTRKWNIPIASVVVFLLLTLAFGAMYYAGGYNFTTAALSNPTLIFNDGFNFWTLAMGASGNTALAWIMGAALISWNILLMAFQVQIWPRMIFAQAFDRYLPSKLAQVSQNGALVIGNILNLVLTVILTAVAVLIYASLQVLFASLLASIINFMFVGIAAAVYASRNQSKLKLLLVAGILQSIANAFIAYEMLSNPVLWGTAVTVGGVPGWAFAYGYVAASFAVGAVTYLISKSYHKQRGIDISLAFKEIPPE